VVEAGTAVGLVFLLAGVSGNSFFGWLSDTLEQRGVRSAKLKVAGTSVALGAVANSLGPLSPNGAAAVAAFAVTIFVAGGTSGTISAALQTMTPNRLRATVSAVYLFCFNVIGLGLGPLAVALVSDRIFGGGANLRYGIVAVAATAGPLASVLLFLAAGRIKVIGTEETAP
jgi:MFS family permease